MVSSTNSGRNSGVSSGRNSHRDYNESDSGSEWSTRSGSVDSTRSTRSDASRRRRKKKRRSMRKKKEPSRILVYGFTGTLTIENLSKFLRRYKVGSYNDLRDRELLDWFGDGTRLSRMKKHFERLTRQGFFLCICSMSADCKTISDSLESAELSKFFPEGFIFGKDHEWMKDLKSDEKYKLITMVKGSVEIQEMESVVLVDSDKKNILSANDHYTCLTLYVDNEGGMNLKLMREIEDW